jgi:hypothetical protein
MTIMWEEKMIKKDNKRKNLWITTNKINKFYFSWTTRIGEDK